MHPRLVLLGLALSLVACAGVQFNGDYQSEIKHEVMPLRATVTVLIAPKLREQMDGDSEGVQLDTVRQTLSDAIKKDLGTNGPLSVVSDEPDARLDFTLNTLEQKHTRLWIAMWFLAPLWLFAVPMSSLSVELSAEVRLTSARGDVLYQTMQAASCSRLEGIYYGHDPLSFGCAAKKIVEQVREQLSLGRSDILGRFERNRPRGRPAVAMASPQPPTTNTVVAVFRIRDMTEQLNERVLEQLTEFLSAQVAQQLHFKVVPREQLRERLAAEKSDTMKACYDESCQIELGKAVAASKIISSSLIRVGSRCALNASVFDLKTEAAERVFSAETACDDNALLDAVKQAVHGLH